MGGGGEGGTKWRKYCFHVNFKYAYFHVNLPTFTLNYIILVKGLLEGGLSSCWEFQFLAICFSENLSSACC